MGKKIFIFAESRSGSNWLVETLNSHPQISMLKEILQYSHRNKYYEEQKRNDEYFKYGSDVEYLKQRLDSSEEKWTGCKILFPELRCFDIYDFINYYSQTAYFIILTRENTVRAEVSNCISSTHRRWHERENQSKLLRVHLNPRCFYRRLEWRRLSKEFVINMLSAYNVRKYNISYEKIFRAPVSSIEDICRFLNVNSEEITFSNEKRGNPFSLKEIIKNFEEIRVFLKDYPHYYKMIETDAREYKYELNES